jgi:hypothetical protein
MGILKTFKTVPVMSIIILKKFKTVPVMGILKNLKQYQSYPSSS